MWTNAKRDGCPVEYRWRPLFTHSYLLHSYLSCLLFVLFEVLYLCLIFTNKTLLHNTINNITYDDNNYNITDDATKSYMPTNTHTHNYLDIAYQYKQVVKVI